ncbi:hypothetical protein BJX64DRAFT_284616 [Aspergillus heterothallicus]
MSCEGNNYSCLHCSAHRFQLRAEGVPKSWLYYSPTTYPIIFKGQFVYRYDEDPTEYTSRVGDKLVATLEAHFKLVVPVFGHFKIHQFSPEDEPFIWMSFLADLPLNAKVDKKLEALLFEDWSPSLSDWKTMPSKHLDHPNLERLEWFMARNGRKHLNGCYEAIRILYDNNRAD